MCVVNAFQLWSKGQPHHGQLRFREELMHELLKQLPSEDMPRKRGAAILHAAALVKDHYLERVSQDRDCAHCSRQSQRRVRFSYICPACQVHLCCSECFALYHA